MEEKQLKPCPFCGSSPKREKETLDERFAYADRVTFRCTGCGVSISAVGDTSKPGYADNRTVEARALEAWNRRAAPQAGAELTDAQMEALSEFIFQDMGMPSDWTGFDFDGARRAILAAAQGGGQ
jgi:Lar family restriction alleviation protein